MDIHAFNQLCLNERVEIALHSVFIKSVVTSGKAYKLFKSHDFYIEVEFDDDENTINSVSAFENEPDILKSINEIR